MGDIINAEKAFRDRGNEEMGDDKPTLLHPLYMTYEPTGKEARGITEFVGELHSGEYVTPIMFEGEMTVVFLNESGQYTTYAFTAYPRAIVTGGNPTRAEQLFAKRVQAALDDLNKGVEEDGLDDAG